MQPSHRSTGTTVTQPAWVRLLVWVSFPLLGGGAAWLLKAITGWVVALPWAPLQGPFMLLDRLVAYVGEPRATIGVVAVGAAAGLLLALMADAERLVVTVSSEQVRLVRGENSREISRSSVGAVFPDGEHLVLLGRAGEELVREAHDLGEYRLQRAFVTHGYTWLAGDPHADEYRLWVEGTPDLPPGADTLLGARARALGKGGEGKDDAAELRAELAKIGVVVREDKKRQYWRRAAGRASG